MPVIPISKAVPVELKALRDLGRGIMALSMDIRVKVLNAIVGGMSCRQAAARFCIGPATAIRWAKRVETSGSVAPSAMGGDRRSQRIEAHAVAAPLTLPEPLPCHDQRQRRVPRRV